MGSRQRLASIGAVKAIPCTANISRRKGNPALLFADQYASSKGE
ncbi:hypothetical protein [Pseudomonas segetis]|nr:hypothetical protein [Pseudomonas segetis]